MEEALLCIYPSLFPTKPNTGVGKSCLLLRYSDDTFTQSFITTIGYVFLEPIHTPPGARLAHERDMHGGAGEEVGRGVWNQVF
jgi:hypothetical protein